MLRSSLSQSPRAQGQRQNQERPESRQVKDAACGMMIDPAKAVAAGNTLHRDGATYYFCSERCKRNFTREPEHYLALNPPQRRP